MSRASQYLNKTCVLWGTHRHIYELFFLFRDLNVLGIVPTDKKNYDIDLPILQLDELHMEEKLLIVICDVCIEYYQKYLEKQQLVYGKDYIFFGDLFCLLDEYNEDIVAGRKIAVWGIGETTKNFHHDCKNNNYEIDVNIYIDGSAEKTIDQLNGKPVYLSDELENIEQYFIIVCSLFYFDIKERLQNMGLKEGKDFLPFSKFSSKPSEMMKKQVLAESRENFYCDRPYIWLYYSWFGTYCCCSTWVDYPIGNAATEDPIESWNSVTARLYRLSADTRTYCFCKKDSCGIWTSKGSRKSEILSIPQVIVLGLDTTCNLYCSSCRDCIKVAKGEQLRIREVFADNIIKTGWISEVKELQLSGSGEALMSKVDRRIMFSEENTKRKAISLLTNGNLFNEQNWEKIKKAYKEISVFVSIDAASEETYHAIRRGGDWELLQKNLAFMSDLRAKGEIRYIEIRMVIQRKNYKEIIPFIKMGDDYKFDKVVFTKLLNWNMYTSEEYEYEAMISKNDEIDPELRIILTSQEMKNSIVDAREFERYF